MKYKNIHVVAEVSNWEVTWACIAHMIIITQFVVNVQSLDHQYKY